MRYRYKACCDVGLRRKNNEDNFYIDRCLRADVNALHYETEVLERVDEPLLCGVFDGMGGEANGELASLEACKLLRDYEGKPFELLSTEYIIKANNRVCDMITIHGKKSMGSTLAIALFGDHKFSFCNIGDSPVYLFRDGVLEQLSVDHNEAQTLYELGWITKEQLKTDKRKNILTQHLGIYEDEMVIEPFVVRNKLLSEGDRILICSDGLPDSVSADDIAAAMNAESDTGKLVDKLLEMALSQGARDNITIMIIDAID